MHNAVIHRAMATQVDRANGQSNTEQRIAELEQANARLQHRLDLAQQRVRALEAQLATHRPAADPAPTTPLDGSPNATLTYKDRPATTPQRVAAHYDVHVSTITRRLNAGKLAGEQLPGSNRWVVYLDQPIGPFRRR